MTSSELQYTDLNVNRRERNSGERRTRSKHKVEEHEIKVVRQDHILYDADENIRYVDNAHRYVLTMMRSINVVVLGSRSDDQLIASVR